MRNFLFILIAVTLVWTLAYFTMLELGYPIQKWTILLSASLAAIYAGLFVLLGETIIEDGLKIALFLILSGIAWFADPTFSFIFICVVIAGGIGTVLNQINRKQA